MKKVLSIMSLVLATLTLFLCMTACGAAKEKEFSVSGMTITLTDEFETQSVVTQTATYVSKDVMVAVLKESFVDMGVTANRYTLGQYTDMVISVNGLTGVSDSAGDGYNYFTYEKNVDAKDLFYYATTHKTSDAFWLIQFGCEKNNAEKYTPKFEEWTKTIKFD